MSKHLSLPSLFFAGLGLLSLTSVALPGEAHADRVIDAFTDSFPNTTLPGTSTPSQLLWAGRFAGSTQIEQTASQSNLAGVVGGQRYSKLREASLTTLVTSSVYGGELSTASGSGGSGVLSLEYGALNPLNLNLTSDGSLAFELDINGDMNDGGTSRPITLTITARSGSSAAVSRSYQLLRDGVYQFPFSAFSGVNFADVDYLKFNLDGSAYQAIDYTLTGGLRTSGCLQAGVPIADRFIDTFRAPMPLRSLPGVGTAALLWAGTLNGVSKQLDIGSQSGLAGTIGGQRQTIIEASTLQNFLNVATIAIGPNAALSYATATGTSGSLNLEYGAQTNLNANLSAMRAFEFELDSDLNAGGSPRPVPLTITVASSSGSASTQVTLLNDGTYYVPFTSLPGVNFADVDYLEFHFDATTVNAVDYALIGGLRASACIR